MVRPTVESADTPIPPAVRSLRWVVVALLLASAAVTLFVLPALQEGVAGGRLADAVLLAPVALLGTFVAGFAAYRFLLVRAGRYAAGKALAQVLLMVIVVGVVGGASLDRYRAARSAEPVDLARALASDDPQIRALAAEVLRHRGRADAARHADRLIALLSDPSAEVRRQAHLALVAIAGEDAGGAGPDAPARWRAHLRARDDLPR